MFVENLQVKHLSKSAAGTTDNPGRNVKAKSGLNRSILDQAWGEFRHQLDYKLDWLGGRLTAVPPQNTSRTCPECGHVSADNRKTQARFACVNCGFEGHADVVAAINIRDRGLSIVKYEGQDFARIACEVSGAAMPPAAGPTEVTQTWLVALPKHRRNPRTFRSGRMSNARSDGGRCPVTLTLETGPER